MRTKKKSCHDGRGSGPASDAASAIFSSLGPWFRECVSVLPIGFSVCLRKPEPGTEIRGGKERQSGGKKRGGGKV